MTGGQGSRVRQVSQCPTKTHNTKSNGSGKVFVEAMQVRRLMPIECERLQGFPDGHTDELTDSGRYRALGNAVAVPVAEWIGRRIRQIDGR